jgi:hypothetical protein
MINNNILLILLLLLITNSCFQKKEDTTFKYQHNVDILNDSIAIAKFKAIINSYNLTMINQDTSKYILTKEDKNPIYANIYYCIGDYKSDTVNWENIAVKKELQITIQTLKPKPLKQDIYFVEMWSFNSIELAAGYFELLKVIEYKCSSEDIRTYPILFRNKILILYVMQPLKMNKQIDEDAIKSLYEAVQCYLDNKRDLEINGIDILKKFSIIE